MKATRTHSNNRAYLVLVVEDDGQVIGDLAGLMIETAALRPACLVELERMGVAASRRGKQTGEALAWAFFH